jgi:uncharacterized protein YyaL (SSP411 family)
LSLQTNRLIDEKSPYLLQHAHNPVDWYPWGDEAFRVADEKDRPIFLSIGYSTCHWCHVMEKESFEDREIADILNREFVSVKVDREERPDVDSAYMDACQLMTGSGGWPLTIIMRPDKKPFFAGTYIPKEGRFGMIGLKTLLLEIAEAWKNRRGEVDTVAERATSTMKDRLAFRERGRKLDREIFDSLYTQLEESFDDENGGFGLAPKFPIPHKILSLLRYWRRTGNPRAIEMVEDTLLAMRRGGIWDHVGYGFHRYSTDRKWLVPHFEKMLYDQALMLMAYAEAFQATGIGEFHQTAWEIFEYVSRDMTSPEGAFYSAEDADSEGEEGKFYLWAEAEMERVLEERAELLIDLFEVRREGNFLDEATGKKTGKNILHTKRALDDLSKEIGLTMKELRSEIHGSLALLRIAREERVRPLLDDKILADWNGLMIAALAKASRIFDSDELRKAGERAAGFILGKMYDEGLRHRYRGGDVSGEVFLQDYSFMIWGLIELYQATFDRAWLEWAISLTREMIEGFWDEEKGWFLLSHKDGESMILQKMEAYDGAIPSGNSVAFLDLILLSRITGDESTEERADRLADAFSVQALDNPIAYTLFLSALDMAIGPSAEVVIVGELTSRRTEEMLSGIRTEYLPGLLVLLKADDSLSDIAPFTEAMDPKEGEVLAYVCVGRQCRTPTDSVDQMIDYLMQRA